MARNTKSITKGYKGGQSSGSSKHPGQPKRPPLTHFLCIPLVTETSKLQLEASLLQFQESVSAKFLDGLPVNNTPREFGTPPRAPLISPKAIRPIGTIHFTLGVMSLENENKVQEAVDYLQSLNLSNMANEMNLGTVHMGQTECPLEIDAASSTPKAETELPTNPINPLSISLTSLYSMHSPKSTSILYAGADDPNGRLFQMCVLLRNSFEKKGYLVSDDRPLKLHATIVNTIYAKAGHRGGGNLRIDAEDLLEEWKDFVWAKDFPIEKLAICRMGAKKITNANGEMVGEQYEEIASIPFFA